VLFRWYNTDYFGLGVLTPPNAHQGSAAYATHPSDTPPACPIRDGDLPCNRTQPGVPRAALVSAAQAALASSIVPHYTIRISRQLQRSPGLMGYSLHTKPFAGRFWTLSVWENEAALQAFVQAAPHQETMRALIAHMGPTRFVRWTVLGAQLPVHWDEALRR
jgi:quinol monooxygenase YgiN